MTKKREWLIQIRNARKITRLELAKKLNITGTAYFYIENNQRNPSVELAKKIADILNFDWTLFYENKAKCQKKKNRR